MALQVKQTSSQFDREKDALFFSNNVYDGREALSLRLYLKCSWLIILEIVLVCIS